MILILQTNCPRYYLLMTQQQKTLTKIAEVLNKELIKISDWFNCNKLSLNIEKKCTLVFSQVMMKYKINVKKIIILSLLKCSQHDLWVYSLMSFYLGKKQQTKMVRSHVFSFFFNWAPLSVFWQCSSITFSNVSVYINLYHLHTCEQIKWNKMKKWLSSSGQSSTDFSIITTGSFSPSLCACI